MATTDEIMAASEAIGRELERGDATARDLARVSLDAAERIRSATAEREAYERGLLAQQQQYANGAEIHDLPPIFHYWTHRYVLPLLQGALDANSITEVYAKPMAELARRHDRARFFSIGSGTCAEEIAIARWMLVQGCNDFEIVGLEVAENLIAEAEAAIAREGLQGIVSTQFFDVNRNVVEGPVHAWMANQSLHHIKELERLFDLIDRTLTDDGHFITCDMIGRNGHLRWPETLREVERVWPELSKTQRFHWQWKRHHETFLNWDCTQGGADWEGIRAQDILPLLLDRFSFAAFAAAGGFIEIFVDRGYGANFSPDNQADRDFIDRLAQRNDALIDDGVIKPTMIYADMMKKGIAPATKVIGKRTPEFCVRYP